MSVGIKMYVCVEMWQIYIIANLFDLEIIVHIPSRIMEKLS